MPQEDKFTPRNSAIYRRCVPSKPSTIWGVTALVIIFVVLVLMALLMPPLS